MLVPVQYGEYEYGLFICVSKDLNIDYINRTGSNISNTRDGVSSGYANIEKRVENTPRGGLFLTKFEVFG